MFKIFQGFVSVLLLASCATVEKQSTMGSFFDDHVAVLKYVPCEIVGGYEPFDMNPTHFSCAAGKWNEVSMRLDHDGEGNTKKITLYWREYSEGSFFEEANETVLPFVDFLTQRYAKGAESEIYELVNEHKHGNIVFNGLNFKHTLKKSMHMQVMFEQHKLVIVHN